MSDQLQPVFGRSLGVKILIAIVTVIVVVLSAFTLSAVIRENNKAKAALREKGGMLAKILADEAIIGVYAENPKLLQKPAVAFMALNDVDAVIIYTSDRKPLYALGAAAAKDDAVGQPENVEAGGGKTPSLVIRETVQHFRFLRPVLLQPAAESNESLYFGTEQAASGPGRLIGYVEIVLSKNSYRREMTAIVLYNAALMLVFILSGIVIVVVAVRKITRPLADLTESVKAHEKGVHVEPVPVRSNDEIGNLASAFNAMVAARERTEESLRESEERYRMLVELSPDAVYVQQTGKIIFINAAGVRLFGAADAAQVIGQAAEAVIHADDRAIAGKRLQQVEQEGVMFHLLPVRYCRRDGAIVEAEADASPFIVNSQRAVLVIARDVTERKGLEEKVRSYQQEIYSIETELSTIESRIEERERHLIAADLHDYVGQNLAATQFKLGFLRRAVSDPEAAGHLEEIRDLLDQTIRYTRSLTVELSPPVLSEIGFRAAVASLAEEFSTRHGIEIHIADNGHFERISDTDRYTIFRNIRELLMNVVKHARANKVTIDALAAGDRLHITVTDDGVGYDESSIKVDGFGLFAIRDRMKRIGGACDIESQPGAGTTVKLSMPLH